jgi:Zinc dependent phospholipase C
MKGRSREVRAETSPMLYCVAAVAAMVLLALPAEALAWGPLTHLVHGSQLIQDLSTLPEPLQQLLHAHRLAYLYGCIGADITQARRYTRNLYSHCHHWAVGFKLVAVARTDEEQAFAYGYLSHLAADVYAHNYYVPVQLIASFPARTLGHAYWEVRFDALQDRRRWHLPKRVLGRAYPDCDSLVEREVERTLFSFRTNKRIFDSLMALHQYDQWYRMMTRVSARSRYLLPKVLVDEYNERCVTAMADVLIRATSAACVAFDPTGHDILARASRLRRQLRTLRRRGNINERLRKALATISPPSPDYS